MIAEKDAGKDVTVPCDVSCDSVTKDCHKVSQAMTVEVKAEAVIPPAPPEEPPAGKSDAMAVGETLFGVTCTGEPVGRTHWLADSSVCGDMVMSLPSSVLIAARTKEGGGVAVDMAALLDAIPEGVGKFNGLEGVADAAKLPVWSVSRLFGTFPALRLVYDEAMDNAALIVEGAAYKAAIGMTVTNSRKMRKTKTAAPGIAIAGDGSVVATPGEKSVEESEETLTKEILPDAALSKLILISRMKGRYKDEGGMRQAVQINITGAEAKL